MYAKNYLVFPQPNPAAAMRLFCFHYAGGNAALFKDWPHRLTNNVEIIAIQLPGRGSRYQEPVITDFQLLIQNICAAMQPLSDKPAILFGHSLGGLICFEVAREFRRKGIAFIRHLIISATKPPQIKNNASFHYHSFSDNEFIEDLRKYNGTPAAILDNQELMQLLLPRIRADFTLYDNYNYYHERAINTAITLLTGKNDDLIHQDSISQWQLHSNQKIVIHAIDGDHFFINSNLDAVISIIQQIITLMSTNVAAVAT